MALSPETDKKIAAAVQILRAQQAAGKGPVPGQVSTADLARAAGVSEPTVRTIEMTAITKLALGLSKSGIKPQELRLLFKIAPPQPTTNPMSLINTTSPVPPAQQIKDSALKKLEQARQIIASAHEDLGELEGDGYCPCYESCGRIHGYVVDLIEETKALKAPTGLFAS